MHFDYQLKWILPSTEPRELTAALGFPPDRAEIIHAFIGGSALYGVKLLTKKGPD